MSIKFLANRNIKKSEHILLPVCLSGDQDTEDSQKRTQRLRDIMLGFAKQKLQQCKSQQNVSVEFVITGELNRYSLSSEDIRRQVQTFTNTVLKIATEELNWEQGKQFSISYWKEHYACTGAERCISFVKNTIGLTSPHQSTNSHRYDEKVERKFNAAAQSFFQRSGISRVKIMGYLTEEYGVFLWWRIKYRNPIIVQGYISDEKRKILRWINHIPLSRVFSDDELASLSSSGKYSSAIQQLTYVDEKEEHLSQLQKSEPNIALTFQGLFKQVPAGGVLTSTQARNLFQFFAKCDLRALPDGTQQIVTASATMLRDHVLLATSSPKMASDNASLGGEVGHVTGLVI